MCLYMVKKDHVKKIEKGDVVTRFWYTLRNLDLDS
jgi:hypothetical protein